MRKKTIKFYFFKKETNAPSTTYLSFFSKRSIKQFKKNKKLYQLRFIKQKKKQLNIITDYLNSRRILTHKLYYNQWIYNDAAVHTLFLKSFYQHTKLKHNSKILLWFKTKNRLYLNTYRDTTNYPKTGILSSHLVHFFLYKNLVYQSRSKYRASIRNLNAFSRYIYWYCMLMSAWTKLLKKKMYFFTSTLSKKNYELDDFFGRVDTHWETSKLMTDRLNLTNQFTLNTYTGKFLVNSDMYGFNHYHALHKYRNQLVALCTSLDAAARDKVYSNLVKSMGQDFTIEMLSQYRLLTYDHSIIVYHLYDLQLWKYVVAYYIFYKTN